MEDIGDMLTCIDLGLCIQVVSSVMLSTLNTLHSIYDDTTLAIESCLFNSTNI